MNTPQRQSWRPGGEELSDVKLEDLVSREGLLELVESVVDLFGIPIRVYSASNGLLADAAHDQEVCNYVNTFGSGRTLCGTTVSAAKSASPGETGSALHACFTGNSYRIVALEYETRNVGRLIIGPYLPAATVEVPLTLTAVEGVEPEKARVYLARMPRAKEDTIQRIADHFKRALDLIMFAGHKTFLTSQMHLAAVTESFREMQEKNRRLEEANTRLRELDRLKSNFLATVSHELRTPLTSIIGYSEMLSEGLAGDMNQEQREFVLTIREKGEQLLGLISGLLDLSKLESGTLSVKRKVVSVRSIADTALSTVAPNAKKKGVNLATNIASSVVDITVDPDRFRQVFINLLDNAIKFTPENGTITIVAKNIGMMESDGEDDDQDGFSLLTPVDPRIEIRILDTGIGIPQNERAKVFDAFYQVDSSSTREFGGTGLGLSIVKRLVEAHGGTVHVEGNEPQGTAFVVRIPASGMPPRGT